MGFLMTSRSRTPPDLKWVLNELAAVNGEVARVEQALGRFQARREHLAKTQAALQRVATELAGAAGASFDLSVNTHERWTGRGKLRNCLRQALKDAYPAGLSTSVLTDHVALVFGIELPNAAERKRLMDNSVRSALTSMRRRGEVEPLHDFKGMASRSGIWRLYRAETSLDELRAKAAWESS